MPRGHPPVPAGAEEYSGKSVLGIIYNVIGIPIAAGVFSGVGLTLSPMFGAAAMSLSSVCVVCNALRLNGFRMKRNREETTTMPLKREAQTEKEEQTVKRTMEIEGMMCAHCKAHVEQALSSLPGVQGVVNWRRGLPRCLDRRRSAMMHSQKR